MNDSAAPVDSPALKWIGRLLAVPPAFMLTMSGVFKLMKPDMVTEGFAKMGYPPSAIVPLGAIELLATLLFLIPQTSVLGAVLLTGYLGGATAAHVQAADPWAQIFTPPALGAVIWLSLVFRDRRMRSLLPIRWAINPEQRSSVLVKIFAVLGFVVIGTMTYIAQLPDEYSVARSIKIAAPPEAIFPKMNSMRQSLEWSPWMKLDPNMTITHEGPEEGEGASYKWVGNDQVGAGRLTIIESRPHELVKSKLEFFKPMEDTCVVDFALQPEGNETLVTWKMSGRYPFMGKVMCMFMDMDGMIGKDFDAGLQNLKSLIESPQPQPAP